MLVLDAYDWECQTLAFSYCISTKYLILKLDIILQTVLLKYTVIVNLETCYETVELIPTAYSYIAYSNVTVLRSQLVLWQDNSPNSAGFSFTR